MFTQFRVLFQTDLIGKYTNCFSPSLISLSKDKNRCCSVVVWFNVDLMCKTIKCIFSHLSSVVSPEPRMFLQRCSGKGRWSGWTCSATGTSGWSRDTIRSAPSVNYKTGLFACLDRPHLNRFSFFSSFSEAVISAVPLLSPGSSFSLLSSFVHMAR